MQSRTRTVSFAALALSGAALLSSVALRTAEPGGPAGVEDGRRAGGREASSFQGAPPLGHPVGLSCKRAHAIVAEVRARLAIPVRHIDDPLFAELAAGWLDPHGLWSAASDAPAGALLYQRAQALRMELESARGDCSEARALGAELERWVNELALVFDLARGSAAAGSTQHAFELVTSAIFEDDPVTLPASELARRLGERTGAFEGAFASVGASVGDAGRSRYFPEFSQQQWQEVVLAAAVRAYVAVVDPHGQWVPHEEEASLYVDDPTFGSEPRLWLDMMRTPVGVRIIDGPAEPLELDDLVLAVDGVLTAGLSVEHVDELARAPFDAAVPIRHVLVLRQTSSEAQTEIVSLDLEEDGETVPALDVEYVPYGTGSALLVRIPDVPDDLGHELASLVSELEQGALPTGMLLDLRGNGGGSTEGACGALGVFLPGAPVFPLMHRGRIVEVLSAAAPSRTGRWRGPVAALVDQRTASAAEMIAGALDRYGRGATVGTRTFGKGCVQEYFDDVVGAGVLRLTTLLFALPDGAPVQRVGLEPRVRVDLEAHGGPGEREADLKGAMPAVAGPDVRAAPWLGGPGWPDHQGRVGPCSDPAVCAALRRIGGGSAAVRRESAAKRRRSPGPR